MEASRAVLWWWLGSGWPLPGTRGLLCAHVIHAIDRPGYLQRGPGMSCHRHRQSQAGCSTEWWKRLWVKQAVYLNGVDVGSDVASRSRASGSAGGIGAFQGTQRGLPSRQFRIAALVEPLISRVERPRIPAPSIVNEARGSVVSVPR